MTTWPMVPLGEVLQLQRRWIKLHPTETYREIGIRSFGKGIFHKAPIAGSTLGNKRVLRIEPGDLVFNNVFAWEGAVAVAGPEEAGMIGSHRFVTYTVNPNKSTAEFLKLFFATPSGRELLVKASPGSAGRNKTLGLDRFISQSIPLPPLAEQRRVVARIEELAAQIHEARTLRQQADDESKALGKAGGNSSFIEAKKRFGSKRLVELTTRITKGDSPEWQGFTYQETGPHFIRSENVLWGNLDPRNAVHISEAFHAKLSRSQLRKDDVLINLVGASIGRACSVPENLGDANVNQAVGVISPNQECLLPEFLVHFLLSPIAQDEIHGGKVETARPNISLGNVRGLRIPTPPLDEQRRIVAELDALQAEVEALKRLQAETAAELAALLPAILDRAFKGEL